MAIASTLGLRSESIFKGTHRILVSFGINAWGPSQTTPIVIGKSFVLNQKNTRIRMTEKMSSDSTKLREYSGILRKLSNAPKLL